MSTSAALRNAVAALKFAIRAYICETLILWGIRSAPAGYAPGIVEDLFEAQGRSPSPPNSEDAG